MENLIRELERNLEYVQSAMNEMDSFGGIGAGPLLDHARSILSELEKLEEKLKLMISTEEAIND